MCTRLLDGRDVAQAVEHPPVKVGIIEIEPRWQVHLQFGLFSVPTGGPQVWYVLACLWESAIKYPLLLIGKSSLCVDSRFPLKEICHNDHMLDV